MYTTVLAYCVLLAAADSSLVKKTVHETMRIKREGRDCQANHLDSRANGGA